MQQPPSLSVFFMLRLSVLPASLQLHVLVRRRQLAVQWGACATQQAW